jgi:hypothetical protein
MELALKLVKSPLDVRDGGVELDVEGTERVEVFLDGGDGYGYVGGASRDRTPSSESALEGLDYRAALGIAGRHQEGIVSPMP